MLPLIASNINWLKEVNDTDTAAVTAVIVALLGSGIINVMITQVFTMMSEKKNKKEGIQESLRLLMKDRLRFLCVHYIQQGWIYEDELEDLITMHKCYHDELKGNGYLDELMKRVNELDIKGIGVK